jgi:hypothetical protein
VQLRQSYPGLLEAGLQIVVIGMGTPEQSHAFRAQLNLPFPVLSDPEKRAYRAYGLGRVSWRKEVRPDNLVGLVRHAARHGVAATPDQDMRQLGGYFLVGREGKLLGAYPYERIADLTDIDALIKIPR